MMEPLSALLSTGVFQGDQAQELQEFFRSIEACEIVEFGHYGDRHGKLHAVQGLKGLTAGLKCQVLASSWSFWSRWERRSVGSLTARQPGTPGRETQRAPTTVQQLRHEQCRNFWLVPARICWLMADTSGGIERP
jgi:hypothetical protein